MSRTSLKSWWKSRPVAVARATVAALVLAWVAYVALINVFLSTAVFDRIVNADPITLDIHFGRAWSLWPGKIHARQLTIRSSDSNVEWILRVDDVAFDVSFLALIQRRFEADHVRGRGVSMRVRQKLTVGPRDVDDIASLPPIPGFPAYSMAPAGPHSLELWQDKVYELIAVRLEDTVAEDVREIWVDDVRFVGHAKIAGRFYLKPLRAVDIGPIHTEIASGEVTKGLSQLLAQNVGGQFDLCASRFDPRAVHDNEPLRYFDITTDLHATLNDLAKMPFGYPVYLAGVVEAEQIGLHIQRGVLAPGTEITASTPRLLAAKNDIIGYSAVTLHAVVDDEKRLQADVQLRNSEVVRPDYAEILHVDVVSVHADSARLDLADGPPFGDVHLATEIDNASVADARMLRLDSGRAVLNGLAEAWPSEKRAAASVQVRYDDIGIRSASVQAHGSGNLAASFGSFQWDEGVVEGIAVDGEFHDTGVHAKDLRAGISAGTLALRVPRVVLADPALDVSFVVAKSDVAFANAEIAAKGHLDANGHLTIVDHKLAGFDADVRAARVAVTKGKLEATAAVNAHIGDASIANDRLSLADSRVAITSAKGTLDGKSVFAAARVEVDGRTRHLDLKSPDLKTIDAHIALNDVVLTNAAALQPLLSPKSKLRLTSGSAIANGDVVLAGERGASGQIQIDVKRAGLAVERSTLVADATLQTNVNGYDPETSTVDLSGTRLALRNVAVANAAAETQNWHGDVVFDKAGFSWADGRPALGADIVLTAEDAKPILGLLLRDHAPKLIAKLATMPNLALRGHVDADPDDIVLSDFDVRGGDVAIRGAYAIKDGDKSGAFVVSKGDVAMGLRIGNDGAHPKFFGLDQWLTTEEKKVKTAPKSEPASLKTAGRP